MGKDRINDQNKCYEAPQAEISSLETMEIVASSNLENPQKGDEWNWE